MLRFITPDGMMVGSVQVRMQCVGNGMFCVNLLERQAVMFSPHSRTEESCFLGHP